MKGKYRFSNCHLHAKFGDKRGNVVKCENKEKIDKITQDSTKERKKKQSKEDLTLRLITRKNII